MPLQARDLPRARALWYGEPSTPERGLGWESSGEAPGNTGESREGAPNQDPSNCHISQLHQLETPLSQQLGPDVCGSHHLQCTSVPRCPFQSLPAVLLSSAHSSWVPTPSALAECCEPGKLSLKSH